MPFSRLIAFSLCELPSYARGPCGTTDLVTVNAGSNNLTLISGFEGTSPVTTTIASGGVDPGHGFFAFSSNSGPRDLVVGNAGDGVLSLFEGEQAG